MSHQLRGCVAGALVTCVLIGMPAIAVPGTEPPGSPYCGSHIVTAVGLPPVAVPVPSRMSPHMDPDGLTLAAPPSRMGPHGELFGLALQMTPAPKMSPHIDPSGYR
jgi:hypothetical protein